MKGKKLDVLGIIVTGISFFIYIAYLILSNTLLSNGMEFRENVIEFIAWDKFVFIIMLNIVIIRTIRKRKNIGKDMKLLFTLISFFTSVIITFLFVLVPYVFTSRGETLAYKEGNLLLAVSSSALHDSWVNFYEPINSIVMKKLDIEEVRDNSPGNCYYYGKSKFLENHDFDISDESDFIDLKPWSAKEKFGGEVFNYLGDQTYDFGGIVIKFNKRETWVKEASIERNIVKYEDVNIIGENIETIKENISKVKREYDSSAIYKEFLDEKGNINVRIGSKYRIDPEYDYSIHYYDTTLILDDNGIVTSVRYLNNIFEDVD